MIWLLRSGILLQTIGGVLLSWSLVQLLFRDSVDTAWVFLRTRLHRFLRWLLNNGPYKDIRLRKKSHDDPLCGLCPDTEDAFGRRIREISLSILILLAIAVGGYIFIWLAIALRYPLLIICAIALAAFLGGIMSKDLHGGWWVAGFVTYTIGSPLLYSMLILGALSHLALMLIIGCLALLQDFLSRRSVEQGMLILGGLCLVVGAALQLAQTFF